MLRLTALRRLSTYIGKDFMNPPAGQLHDPTKILGNMDVDKRNAANAHDVPNKNAGRHISDILRETERKDERREARNPDAEEHNAQQPSQQKSVAEQKDDEELMEDLQRDRRLVEEGKKKSEQKEQGEDPKHKEKVGKELFSGGTS